MPVSIPEQIGPYRVEEVIGQGGMGVVYRAVHQNTGATVALKTVRVTNADLRASIRREVLALRKVAHPDVVRIEEVGVNDVGPWYAMELLTGETLRDQMSRRWGLSLDALLSQPDDATMDLSHKGSGGGTGRARSTPGHDARATRPAAACGTLDETLTLFRRLCIPLAFVHGQGIVHRDLKPANVFLRVDGTPVLMDFGVVATVHGAAGREVVDVGSQLVGTTGYMAPEQISGERVDARCDLYALGCMLYEALTGSVPFVGRTAMEVVGMHLMQAPEPPSRRVEGIPPALDELVLGLLAKAPRDRVGYADDVARALWEIFRARQGDAALPSTPATPPSAYLYRPGIIGREETLAALRERVNGLDAGRGGGIVLLGGESGVGKTRVVAEAAQHAGRNHVLVVAGECVSLPRAEGADRPRTSSPEGSRSGSAAGGDVRVEGRGSALQPFRGLFQAIADRCTDEGPAVFAKWLSTWGRVLALYEPSIADVPGFADLPALPDLPAPAARRRTLEAVRDTLAAVSKDEPVLLVIDDLQWADDLTVTLLTTLGPAFFARYRVLVFGTFRDTEIGATLPRLLSAPAVTRVKVARLEGRAVSALISDMLALAEPPPALVDFLAERSHGNPFYVSEYLRMAIAEGLLGRDPNGRWVLDARGADALPAPRSLLDLVGRRLRGLAPDARAVVEAAAVLSREVETALLVAVSGLPEASVLEALAKLSHRQIVEETGGDRFRLVHDKLREAAGRDLTPARRRELHRRAAEALEETLRGDPALGTLHGDLVVHWREAGEPEREAVHAGRAGDRAYQHGAFADTARYLEIAITWHQGRARDDAARLDLARWCWQAGDAAFVAGNFEQAERWLVAAMEPYAPRMPERTIGRARFLLGHVMEQVQHGMRVRRASTAEREGLTIAAHAAGKLAHVAIFRGDGAAVLAASLAAANLAERAGDAHVDALGALGYAAGTLGLDALAQRYFDRARAAAAAPTGAGVTWRGRAAAALLESVWRMGRDERARAHVLIDGAIAQTRFNGDRLDEGLCVSVLAMLHWYDGRFDAMRDALVVALDALGDDMSGQRSALVHAEAFAHLSAGDAPAAKAALAALAAQPDRADALVRSLTRAMQAAVCLAEGRLAEAVVLAEEALAGVGSERTIPPTAVHLWEGTLEVFLAARRAERDVQGRLAGAVARVQRWAKAQPVGRVLALRWAGLLAWVGGDVATAGARWREALVLAREGGQRAEEAYAEALLALYAMPAGAAREAALGRARARWLECGATARLAWLDEAARV